MSPQPNNLVLATCVDSYGTLFVWVLYCGLTDNKTNPNRWPLRYFVVPSSLVRLCYIRLLGGSDHPLHLPTVTPSCTSYSGLQGYMLYVLHQWQPVWSHASYTKLSGRSDSSVMDVWHGLATQYLRGEGKMGLFRLNFNRQGNFNISDINEYTALLQSQIYSTA